jgi:hypothetical protein
LRKTAAGGAADATTTAGDDGHLVVKSAHGLSFEVLVENGVGCA